MSNSTDKTKHASSGKGSNTALCSSFWLRTKSEPKFYVCEMRGVCFLTFVPEQDKAQSANFPTRKNTVEEWKKLMESMCGFELEAVAPFV